MEAWTTACLAIASAPPRAVGPERDARSTPCKALPSVALMEVEPLKYGALLLSGWSWPRYPSSDCLMLKPLTTPSVRSWSLAARLSRLSAP